MPTCKDVELLLLDYLDGYLLPSQREVLESHVRGCPSCSTVLQGIRGLDEELEDIPQVVEPEEMTARVLRSLPPPHRPERTSWKRPSHRVFLALAALLLAAVLFPGGPFRGPLTERSHAVEIVFSAPGAGSVALVGDFNGWSADRNAMSLDEKSGLWKVRLTLPPGVYGYGFVIDGKNWTPDPNADRFIADGFGGENSLLIVGG